MIAWKAQYGYWPKNVTAPTDLTGFTVTDSTVFGFPQILNLTANVTNRDGRNTSLIRAKPESVTETLQTAMSDDFYAIWPTFNYAVKNSLLVNWISSTKAVAPNLYDLLLNSSSMLECIGCYIPSLNKMIRLTYRQGPVKIYLTDLNTGGEPKSFFLGNYAYDPAAFQLVYIGEVNETEMLKPSNYKALQLEYLPINGNVGYAVINYTDSYNDLKSLLSILFRDFTPPDAGSTDPYDPSGPSGPGGGGGSFSDSSDNIGFSGVPDYDIGSSGFVSLLAPTTAQLKNLASYMWDTLNMENWKKIFADPIDAIIGLTLVPCAVTRGGITSVKVGNIDTGVEMSTLSSQIAVVDCGSLAVGEYFASYLDYDPYTKMELFLPFIGYRPIKADEVMGKTIHVKYYVDLLSGACNAQVVCGTNLLYSFAGSVGYQVPITSNNWSNWLQSVISLSGAAITTIATGGAAAPMTAGTAATASVNMFKQNVDRSGTLAGNAGYLSQLTPYLVITRPKIAIPKDQNKFMGYPSLIASSLGDLSGYTEIKEIHLENIPCTEEELSEIESMLKGGVIL